MLRRVRMILDCASHTRARARVIWNHHTVYQGEVQGNIEWDTEANIWGHVNLEIEITGHGSMIWQDLHMNHTGCLLCLPGSESSGGRRVLPPDFYSPPSLAADCRSDVRINGEIVAVDRDSEHRGAWHYDLSAPCRVQARVRIDRQKTMLWAPVI